MKCRKLQLPGGAAAFNSRHGTHHENIIKPFLNSVAASWRICLVKARIRQKVALYTDAA